MDLLIKADKHAKELEKLFIEYTLRLIKKGYIFMAKKKRADDLDDIADVIRMMRQLGRIYTGIDLAPDMTLNKDLNVIMADLQTTPFKATSKKLHGEFLYEMTKAKDQRNTSYYPGDLREEKIKQLIKEAKDRAFAGLQPIKQPRIQREEKLNELSRVVQSQFETLNQMSARTPETINASNLLPLQQDDLNEISSNSRVVPQQQDLASNQIMQHFNHISQKSEERHASNFQHLSKEVKEIIEKMNQQQVVISKLSENNNFLMSELLKKGPVGFIQNNAVVDADIPNSSSIMNVGSNIANDVNYMLNNPNNSSDLFLSPNQFAHNIPLS